MTISQTALTSMISERHWRSCLYSGKLTSKRSAVSWSFFMSASITATAWFDWQDTFFNSVLNFDDYEEVKENWYLSLLTLSSSLYGSSTFILKMDSVRNRSLNSCCLTYNERSGWCPSCIIQDRKCKGLYVRNWALCVGFWHPTLLTSNQTHFLRITETSFDCSGATSCLTVNAIFFRLFHFSGSSCSTHK